MNFISNVKSDFDEQISFNINNQNILKPSFINAIRRIAMTDIEIFAISARKTNFSKNNSVLDNEFISHRLSLCPIIYNESYDIENISLILNKKFENKEKNIITVYLNDFIVKNGDEIIENKNFFKYPNTPITKLKENQEIMINSKLEKGTCRDLGAAFSCVCPATYYFDFDKNSEDENKERQFNTDKNNNPTNYTFTIETCGNFDKKEILNITLSTLRNKFNRLKNDIIENIGLYVKFGDSNTSFKCIDIEFIDENDTVGNLLSQTILEEEGIIYCGYKIPHPLKNNFILRISYKNNDKNEISDLIVRNIDKIIDLINKFEESWNKVKN